LIIDCNPVFFAARAFAWGWRWQQQAAWLNFFFPINRIWSEAFSTPLFAGRLTPVKNKMAPLPCQHHVAGPALIDANS
jgi:hypothetical protein